jgi:hypothetical protein
VEPYDPTKDYTNPSDPTLVQLGDGSSDTGCTLTLANCHAAPTVDPQLLKWGNKIEFSVRLDNEFCVCKHTAKVFVFLASRNYTFEADELVDPADPKGPNEWDWNLKTWNETLASPESWSMFDKLSDCVNTKVGVPVLFDKSSSWFFGLSAFWGNRGPCEIYIRGSIKKDDPLNGWYSAVFDQTRDADGSRKELYGSTDVQFMYYNQSDDLTFLREMAQSSDSELSEPVLETAEKFGFRFQWGSWNYLQQNAVVESADVGVSLVLEKPNPKENVFPYIPDPLLYNPRAVDAQGEIYSYEGPMTPQAFAALQKLYEQGLQLI